jgi:hypothetical protein
MMKTYVWLAMVLPVLLVAQDKPHEDGPNAVAQGKTAPHNEPGLPSGQTGLKSDTEPLFTTWDLTKIAGLAGLVSGIIIGAINAIVAIYNRRAERLNKVREIALQAAITAYKGQEWRAENAIAGGRDYKMQPFDGYFMKFMVLAEKLAHMKPTANSFESAIKSMADYDRVFQKWLAHDYAYRSPDQEAEPKQPV